MDGFVEVEELLFNLAAGRCGDQGRRACSRRTSNALRRVSSTGERWRPLFASAVSPPSRLSLKQGVRKPASSFVHAPSVVPSVVVDSNGILAGALTMRTLAGPSPLPQLARDT